MKCNKNCIFEYKNSNLLTMKIKLLCLFVSFTVFTFSNAQDYGWGVGGRMGNPFGGSLKKYLSEKQSLELTIGRYYKWGYSYSENYKGYVNISESAYRGIQLHYFFQKDFGFFTDVPGKFQWYYGGGVQYRSGIVKYQFFDIKTNDYIRYKKVDVDFGIDLTGGAEYTFEEIPLTLFIDHTIFVEFIDDFYFYNLPSMGARYNF